MQSYWVKYIDRGGDTMRRLVVASSAREAKRIASEDGCDDIVGVRHAHFIRRLLFRLLLAALAVAGAVLLLRRT